jgi:O-antigen ligase
MLLVIAVSGRNPIGNFAKGLAAITGVVLISYLFNLNSTAVRLSDNVIARHEASDDSIGGRVIDPLLEIGVAAKAAPTGLGFGSEQVAGVFAETGVMNLGRFEYQFPRLVMETGLLGLSGFLITCAGTLYVIFATRRQIANEGLRRVLVLSAFLVGTLFYTNVAFNHIASFFAWVIVAITLASASKAGAVAKAPPRTRAMPVVALSSGVP